MNEYVEAALLYVTAGLSVAILAAFTAVIVALAYAAVREVMKDNW
jgi:hypothetical protein